MPMIDGKYRRPQLRNGKINYRFGWFFVTFQVFENKSLLGAIVGENCILNELGLAVKGLIETLSKYNPEVYVDCFVVMPNHVHLVLKIDDRPTNEEHHLGKIMRKLKSLAAREYRILGSRGMFLGRGGVALAPQDEAGRDGSAPRDWEALGGRGCHPPLPPPVISTFTSPQEREALRRLLAKKRRIVAVYPGGIPAVLPPAIAESVDAGRMLLLSPVESGTGVNKQRAIWCNEYVIRRAKKVWCGVIAPGGTLESILKGVGK